MRGRSATIEWGGERGIRPFAKDLCRGRTGGALDGAGTISRVLESLQLERSL